MTPQTTLNIAETAGPSPLPEHRNQAFAPESDVLREAIARSHSTLANPATAVAAPLLATTILTPKQLEKQKDTQQKAEDIIYTLNHTFTCLSITDFVIIPALRGLGLDIGHTHGPDGKCKASFWKRAGNWMAGEFIGDVGAAIVTIPVQRFFPGFMDMLRRGMEPLVGGFFRRNAEKASVKWAQEKGFENDNLAIAEHAKKLYDYEMQHLPQMAVWTASSVALHYGAMKVMEPDITLGRFARMKAAGAGITALLVFGARAIAPDKAHKWDRTVGKNVIVPVTKTVSGLLGIKASEIDAYHAKQERDRHEGWAERTRAEQAEQPLAAASRTI